MYSSILGITSIAVVLLLTKDLLSAAASNRVKSTVRAAVLQELISTNGYISRFYNLDYTDTNLMMGLQSLLV